jgi:hypothetical protein
MDHQPYILILLLGFGRIENIAVESGSVIRPIEEGLRNKKGGNEV